MYNTDFLEQLEASRRHLFSVGCIEPRQGSNEAYARYFPPKDMKVVECYEDINGEWVPCSGDTNQRARTLETEAN